MHLGGAALFAHTTGATVLVPHLAVDFPALTSSPASHYGTLPALAAPALEASKSLIRDSWYRAAYLVSCLLSSEREAADELQAMLSCFKVE